MSHSALDSMYREILMEHQKAPRNFGPTDGMPIQQEGFNPLCGDRITLGIQCSDDDHKLSEVRFHGEGCSICMASASILTELATGLDRTAVLAEIEKFRDLLASKRPAEDAEGDVEALMGVRQFPVRIKCALLAWTTLKDALEKHPC